MHRRIYRLLALRQVFKRLKINIINTMSKTHIPPLVGVQEVRKMLGGVSKQYVHELIDQEKIIPVQTLACGRIFLKSDIEDFIKKRKDKLKQKY